MMLFGEKSIFTKQITVLASGTGFAQVINVISLPVLTRLYSPAQFGEFAVFLAIVAVLSAISTFKYENAILDEKAQQDAIGSAILTAAFGAVILVPLFFYTVGAYLFGWNVLGINWVSSILLIIAITLFNIFTALYYWCNRQQNYVFMTKGRVYAAIAVAFVSITLGYFHYKSLNGLICGSLIGMCLNVSYLAVKLKIKAEAFNLISLSYLASLSVKLKRFPVYLVPATLLDRFAAQFHIFVFSSIFGNSVAGAMGMYNRAIGLPITLIGNAFRDVYKRKISELIKDNQSCRLVFLKTGISLFLIASPISAALFFFAPEIFVFVLGKQWTLAGEIARFLSLNFLLAFVVSPLSVIFHLGQNQKLDLKIKILFSILLAIGMIVSVIEKNFEFALTVYALAFGFKYLVQLVVSYKLAK